jgi:hypothetical protein
MIFYKLKCKFSIKKENSTVFCDIHSDIKNRLEKFYKYIVNIEKPYKIMFQFYDEEKVIDNKIYTTEDDQKNKIRGYQQTLAAVKKRMIE